MSRRKRIALYGGTFDPVHLGHIAVAKNVCAIFEIDELLFVPAWIAPHKRNQVVTPALHRYAMLALATQDHDELRVSRFELETTDRKYTVETLAHFQSQLGNEAELFFVMGADSWSEIRTWKEWERLLTMSNHIVMTRPGYEIERTGLSPEVSDRIADVRGMAKVALSKFAGQKIFFTDAVQLDISATEIRRAARAGEFERLLTLVPELVGKYITKYDLYRDTNES